MKFAQLAIAATIVAAATAPVSAATLFSDTFSPQQAGWSVPASAGADFLGRFNDVDAPAPRNVSLVTLSVNAPTAGAGSMSFELLAFDTLDDNNGSFADRLAFAGGGSLFTGYFAGYQQNFNTVSSNVAFTVTPLGSQLKTLGLNGALAIGMFAQTYRVELPVMLVAGLNQFSWSYEPLQDLADESWGLDNVVVTGPAGNTSVIPVPGAALLLATGLAGLGVAARRRKT